MAVFPVDPVKQMEKVVRYKGLHPPSSLEKVTLAGKRCKLIVPLNCPDEDGEIVEVFYGSPDPLMYRSEQMAYRSALRYISDFYRDDVDFQDLISANVHVVDPFTLEGWFADPAMKYYELRTNEFLTKDRNEARLQCHYLEEKNHNLEMTPGSQP